MPLASSLTLHFVLASTSLYVSPHSLVEFNIGMWEPRLGAIGGMTQRLRAATSSITILIASLSISCQDAIRLVVSTAPSTLTRVIFIVIIDVALC